MVVLEEASAHRAPELSLGRARRTPGSELECPPSLGQECPDCSHSGETSWALNSVLWWAWPAVDIWQGLGSGAVSMASENYTLASWVPVLSLFPRPIQAFSYYVIYIFIYLCPVMFPKRV